MRRGASTRLRWLACGLLAGVLLTSSATAEATPTFRRLALVVGANDGGSGRTKLRYAHSDARAFARVLRQLGGVKRADLVVLLNPTKLSLLGGIYKVRTQLKAAKKKGVRVEVIFYYSGHSDETGILLRGQRLTYKAIRTAIGDFPADLRIAVLDSCASGALTRVKGGRRRPPFLVDKSSNVKGRAFLTSASASEGAQESDRIKGSYFTHFLISGLRGAADKNYDGKVTLTEAYRYAFHQTLKRTQSSRAGPQHANYDFQLTGSGDLVLTDLRRITARLVLASRMQGRLYIRDKRGRLVAEVAKRRGKAMTIGLVAGRYVVLLAQGKRRYKHKLVIRKNGRLILTRGQMKVATASEAVILRGSGPGGALGREVTVRRTRPSRLYPVNVGLLPWVSINALAGGRTHNYVNLAFLCSRSQRLSGFDLAMGCSFWRDDVRGVQIAAGFTHVGGSAYGIQVAGGYASALGGMRGLQLAGGLALSGPFYGLQLGGGASLALGDAYGAQLAAGLSLARRLSGLQVAAVNITTRGLRGLALGAININAGDSYAGQVAGVNIAGNLKGFQVGAVNVATGTLKGAQISAVNWARRAKGLQLGLINVVEEGDGLVPLGIVNYVGNGILQPTFWATGSSVMNLGVKMGSKQFYGLMGAGLHPTRYTDETTGASENDQRYTLSFGLGAHFDTRWWRMYVDLDLVMNMLLGGRRIDLGNQNWLNQVRLVLGFRPVRQLSLYAGPSLDLLVSQDLTQAGVGSARLWQQKAAPGTNDLNFRLGLSFVVGVQWEPRLGKLNKFW